MAEITQSLIARVGVDLAKNVIQVHAVDGAGWRVVARAIKRDQFLAWCAQLPLGCVVAMEACSGAHAWARRLTALGLDARLGKSPKVLRAVLADVIEDASNELTGLARLSVQQAHEHWRALDERMRWCDQQIGAHVRSSPAAKSAVMRAAKVNGIGEIGASALTAGVGDFKQFKSGHQFGAWLGVVPSQKSLSGVLCVGHSMTTRSMNATQDEHRCGGQGGAAANSG